MTGGGGVCGVCMSAGYLEKNVEYFTPPYLYKQDGSGQLATRPAVSAAPTAVGINTAFSVSSPQAATIAQSRPGRSRRCHPQRRSRPTVRTARVHQVRHDPDRHRPGQRRRRPARLLHALRGRLGRRPLGGPDGAGRQGTEPPDEPGPAPAPAGAPTYPGATLAIKAYLQAYACNGTKAQALTPAARGQHAPGARQLRRRAVPELRGRAEGVDLHMQQHPRPDLAVPAPTPRSGRPPAPGCASPRRRTTCR